MLCLVSSGGLLFENYVISHGTEADSNLVLQHVTSGVAFTSDEELHYYTIKWMHEVNYKCVAPMGYWDSVLEYRGVSRIGRQLSSALKLSLPLTTYDRFKSSQLLEYEHAWRTQAKCNSGVL